MAPEKKSRLATLGITAGLIVTIALSGLAFASNYGGKGARLDSAEQDIEELKKEDEKQRERNKEYDTNIATIAEALKAIKADLEEIKKEIKK